MTNLKDISVNQLQRVIDIKQQIEDLQTQLESIAGGGRPGPGRPKGTGPGPGRPKGKRRMSVAGRKAIAAAAKMRWAAYRVEKPPKQPKTKRRMSAAARAKISASAKARWKKVKAAGKTTL